MNIEDEDYRKALVLGVLVADGGGMTEDQVTEAIDNLSDEERLDIVARYQEYDPNP